ncbi:MAG: hypothetical protein CMF59_16910 [Leptospiraceae bacterium]|nr:hypothetical protein [Leptospiraceae bacterium]
MCGQHPRDLPAFPAKNQSSWASDELRQSNGWTREMIRCVGRLSFILVSLFAICCNSISTEGRLALGLLQKKWTPHLDSEIVMRQLTETIDDPGYYDEKQFEGGLFMFLMKLSGDANEPPIRGSLQD